MFKNLKERLYWRVNRREYEEKIRHYENMEIQEYKKSAAKNSLSGHNNCRLQKKS